MTRLLWVLIALFLYPVAGRADQVEHFRSEWEKLSVDQSPITFNVAGNAHFGMTSYQHRFSENKLAQSHLAVVQVSGYVMFIYAAIAKGMLHLDYQPPSLWISAFSGYFNKGKQIDMRETGSLSLSFRVEYSLFSYPFDKPQDCAAFNGNSAGFGFGGVVCAPPGKTMTKPDAERLLGAVGFPDFLEPKPLAAAP